jgi:hypothetical protein
MEDTLDIMRQSHRISLRFTQQYNRKADPNFVFFEARLASEEAISSVLEQRVQSWHAML